MKIIFAHPRYEYGSYVDYRRLVELSGFPVCKFDEMDLGQEGTVYIVSPANLSLADAILSWKGPMLSRVIYWCLERPDVPPKPIRELVTTEVHADPESVLALPGVSRVWVSDRYFSSLSKKYSHVILGSDPFLAHGTVEKPIWDLCHFSYVWGRRSPVVSGLSQSLRVAGEAWGEERARILRSSRAILNVHQTDAQVGEPLRFALAASYSLPLISETIKDPWPLRPGYDFLMYDYGELQRRTNEILRSVDLEMFGRNLYDTLCRKYTFKKCVEDGVRETL